VPIKVINSETAPAAVGPYAQALEVSGTTRRLYISGQPPTTRSGDLAITFKEQAETVWKNVIAQLHAADMSVENIVKATIILTDRTHIVENREVRQAALGAHTPALTLIFAQLFDEAWLIEVDAIAEK